MGGPIATPFARPILKRIWRANLVSLRTICESRDHEQTHEQF